MVTWNVDQRTALSGHAVTGPDDPMILQAVDVLSADGGTDLSGGLQAGYALAQAHRQADRINRVVVISDGIANVGVTDENLIAGYANDEEGPEGIYLAGIGVGDGVNDTLMNTVTDDLIRGRNCSIAWSTCSCVGGERKFSSSQTSPGLATRPSAFT